MVRYAYSTDKTNNLHVTRNDQLRVKDSNILKKNTLPDQDVQSEMKLIDIDMDKRDPGLCDRYNSFPSVAVMAGTRTNVARPRASASSAKGEPARSGKPSIKRGDGGGPNDGDDSDDEYSDGDDHAGPPDRPTDIVPYKRRRCVKTIIFVTSIHRGAGASTDYIKANNMRMGGLVETILRTANRALTNQFEERCFYTVNIIHYDNALSDDMGAWGQIQTATYLASMNTMIRMMCNRR